MTFDWLSINYLRRKKKFEVYRISNLITLTEVFNIAKHDTFNKHAYHVNIVFIYTIEI